MENTLTVIRAGVTKVHSWYPQDDPFKSLPTSRRVFSNVYEAKTNHMKRFITLEEFRGSVYAEGCIVEEDYKREYLKFLETFTVSVEGRGIDLDKSKDEDYFKLCLLMVQPDVAKSKEEFNFGIHKFYMTDVEKQAEEVTKDVTAKIKAFGALGKMNPIEQRDMLLLYGEDTKSMSDIVVSARLMGNLERNPEKFISMYNNKYKPDMILLKKLLTASLVVLSGGVYKFGEGEGTILGSSEDQVLAYFSNPKHQALKIQMQRDLEEKTNV